MIPRYHSLAGLTSLDRVINSATSPAPKPNVCDHIDNRMCSHVEWAGTSLILLVYWETPFFL
jgi:hypothetical protein